MEDSGTAGPFEVVLTGPDLPEGVELTVAVDLRARTVAAADALVEAVGGPAALNRPYVGANATLATMREHSGIARAQLYLPTGTDEQPVENPYGTALAERVAARETEAASA